MSAQAVPLPPRPPEIPEVVVLSPDQVSMRLTPNEMRVLQKATGAGLDELLGEGAPMADRMQTIVWVKLRRDGFDVTWERAGDVIVEFVAEDPTKGEPSTSSPPSADSGECTPRDVDELSPEEYGAMVRYANAEIEELDRARRARR